MQIIKADSYEEMSQKAANVIAAQVILKRNSVIGLATGSTPIRTYQFLIDHYRNHGVDFSEVTTFNLDEYKGLPADNDQSYRYFMEENLLHHINIEPSKINFLDGMTADSIAECERYEKLIEDAGGIDVQLVGMGNNGHLAFNEPSHCFTRISTEVRLSQSTIDANKRFFTSEDEVPRKALTMGIGTIMKARKIVMIVSGANKALAAEKAFTGPICPEVPASILQMHPDVVVFGDKEALPFM